MTSVAEHLYGRSTPYPACGTCPERASDLGEETAMQKTICAVIIVLLGIQTALAQNSSNPPNANSQKGKIVSTVPPEAVKSLAPTGKLRVAINLGNIVLAQGTPEKPTGVTPELAQELAKHLGVPFELTTFDGAGKAFEAAKAGKVDIVFLAIEPVRAAEIAFTAPYV